MATTITIGANTYNLIAMPNNLVPSGVEWGMNDSAAQNVSPFTRRTQVQAWPGADFWDAKATLPPMVRAMGAPWEAFLAELRGISNVFQLADPRGMGPLGTPRGTPLVNGTVSTNNLPMSTVLSTRGWTASQYRLLLPGDLFQIGYRLHRVCEAVNSDGSGNATISVWPSLREQPADGAPLILKAPSGLFRLAGNRRSSRWELGGIVKLSFQAVEAR
jgi:hypothetical protein